MNLPIPPEILYEILVEVLAEHLHQTLLSETQPQWKAILTLSQVSFAFRDIVLLLVSGALGIERAQDGSLTQNYKYPIDRMRSIHTMAIHNPSDLFKGTFDLSSIVRSPFLHSYMSVMFAIAYKGAHSTMSDQAQRIRLGGGIGNYLELGKRKADYFLPHKMGMRIADVIRGWMDFIHGLTQLSICTRNFDTWMEGLEGKFPQEENLIALDDLLRSVETCQPNLSGHSERNGLSRAENIPPTLSRSALEMSQIITTLHSMSEIVICFGSRDEYRVQERIGKLLFKWKPILYEVDG